MFLFGMCANILSVKTILQYRWMFIPLILAQTTSGQGFETTLSFFIFSFSVYEISLLVQAWETIIISV